MLVAFFVVVTFVCHIALPSHCRLQWSSERFCVTSWVMTMKCSVLYYWSSAGFFRVHLNHERPHPLFSVVLVISFLVPFVLLVLRVWVNSSYCQSRETLFKNSNKVCYKKSLRMFHCARGCWRSVELPPDYFFPSASLFVVFLASGDETNCNRKLSRFEVKRS